MMATLSRKQLLHERGTFLAATVMDRSKPEQLARERLNWKTVDKGGTYNKNALELNLAAAYNTFCK